MRTYLECLPCFIRQALEALSAVMDDEEKIHEALREILIQSAQFNLDNTPPEMGMLIHKTVREKSGNHDPYSAVKIMSTDAALNKYEEVKRMIQESRDPFLTAIQFSIAGNILDFALLSAWDEDRFHSMLESAKSRVLDQNIIKSLKNKISVASNVLILGDNAGETVFDRLFIEQISGPKIIYAVKGSPVINDATYDDAVAAGIDKYARIIDNGTCAPGTVMNLCSDEFKKIFYSADIVIAKGQANFETLNAIDRQVYLFTQIKCPVIARHYDYSVGDWIVTVSPIKKNP